MDIKDFIGKVVISPETGARYVLREITSPYIGVESVSPDKNGHLRRYVYNTINGDPISNGSLDFEDKSLKEAFLKTYGEYCHSRDAYYEEYGYWMRKD